MAKASSQRRRSGLFLVLSAVLLLIVVVLSVKFSRQQQPPSNNGAWSSKSTVGGSASQPPPSHSLNVYNRNDPSANPLSNMCHLYLVEKMFVDKHGDFLSSQDLNEVFFECELLTMEGETDDYLSLSLHRESAEDYAEALALNSLYIRYDSSWVDGYKLLIPPDAALHVVEPEDVRALMQGGRRLKGALLPHERRRQLVTEKTRDKVAIIRVNAPDAAVIHDETTLTSLILGEEDSLMSQYRDCSNGFVNLVAYDPSEPVLNVELENPVGTYDFDTLFLEVNPKVKTHYAVSSMMDIVEHAIYIVPSGLGTALADPIEAEAVSSAPLGHFKGIFVDEFVPSTGLLLHDTAHNRGIENAWEGGDKFGDITGVMGLIVVGLQDACFNGYHAYLMGWFSDRMAYVDPLAEPRTVIDLITFVDYEKADDDDITLINVGNKYFITYNRKKSFNIQTLEHADTALIAENKVLPEPSVGSSNLVAAIDQINPFFAQNNFLGSGSSVTIQVCSVQSGGVDLPDSITLGIGTGETPCQTEVPSGTPSAIPTTTPVPSLGPDSEVEGGGDSGEESGEDSGGEDSGQGGGSPPGQGGGSPPGQGGQKPQPPVFPEPMSDIFPDTSFIPLHMPEGNVLTKQQASDCYDYNDIVFYVNSTIGRQRCSWFVENGQAMHNATHNVLSVFCVADHDAYHFCRSTCGQCSVNLQSVPDCQDSTDFSFDYLGIRGDCQFLSERPHLIEWACGESEIKAECRETCNQCS